MELAFQNPLATLRLLERQDHRRVIKTHLSFDALVYSRKARYVYVARDGRDVAWSLFNHLRQLSSTWYEIIGARAQFGSVPTGPPSDFRTFFLRWFRDDGYPFWPFWAHVQAWWEVRGLPNVLLVHFNELKADLRTTASRLAHFLGVEIDQQQWPQILERCSFSYMREHADKLVFAGNDMFVGGAKSFFHSGTNAGWRTALEDEDLREYAFFRTKCLDPNCAEWLDGPPNQPRVI
jgi:aryl sulfotransferase